MDALRSFSFFGWTIPLKMVEICLNGFYYMICRLTKLINTYMLWKYAKYYNIVAYEYITE